MVVTQLGLLLNNNNGCEDCRNLIGSLCQITKMPTYFLDSYVCDWFIPKKQTNERKNMDPGTLALILEIGIPLLIKLVNDGKENKEAVALAKTAVDGLQYKDLAENIAKSTPEQKAAIVNSLFNVLTGVKDSLGGLFTALGTIGKK